MDDSERRNDLNSPPSKPVRAWGEQTDSTNKVDLSRSVSNQSWVSSSSEGKTSMNPESSFEIINDLDSSLVCISSPSTGNRSPPSLPYQKVRSHNLPLTSPDSTDTLQSYTDKRSSSQPGVYLPQSPPGPIPVPRKRANSSSQKTRYEDEIRKLSGQVNTLTERNLRIDQELESSRAKTGELESSNRELTRRYQTVQSQFSHKSKLAQDLEKEVKKLTQDLSRVQLQPSTVSDESREVSQLKSQLMRKSSDVIRLEQENKALERSLSSRNLESVEPSISGGLGRTTSRSNKRVEVRLSETLQKNKQLEQEIADLKQELEGSIGLQSELENTKWRLQEVTEEKQKLEEEQLANALQQKEGLDIQLQEMAESLSSTQLQLTSTTMEYNHKCTDLTHLQQSYSELQREMQGIESHCQDLDEQLSRAQEEWTFYEEKCTSLENETALTIQELTSSNKKQLITASAERDELLAQRDKLSKQLEQLSQEYQRVCNEHQSVDETYRQLIGKKQQDDKIFTQALDDIQKEADATLGDYNEAACKLHKTEQERDEYRMKHEQALHILAQRNGEVLDAKNKLEIREQEWKKRLEMQRREAQDMSGLMDAQLNQFREDFIEERKAREKMAGENASLKDELGECLKARDAEIRRLKSKLNEQAARRMEDDFEDSEYPDDSGPPLRAVAPDQGRFEQQFHQGTYPGRGKPGGNNY